MLRSARESAPAEAFDKKGGPACKGTARRATNATTPPLSARVPSLDDRFARLLDAHADVPWRIAGAYARTEADREDLYQEMLLQTWRALPAFRGDAAARTWLTRIALNVALGTVRRRHTRLTVEAPAAIEAAPADAPSPAEDAQRSDALSRLYAAIRQLPEVDRALVVLALDETPHAEIGEALGLSVSNVGVRLHRAKKRLAALLADPVLS